MTRPDFACMLTHIPSRTVVSTWFSADMPEALAATAPALKSSDVTHAAADQLTVRTSLSNVTSDLRLCQAPQHC